MIYVFKVYQSGELIIQRELQGMDAVNMALELFPEEHYEVEWYPDTFRYMELNQNISLS